MHDSAPRRDRDLIEVLVTVNTRVIAIDGERIVARVSMEFVTSPIPIDDVISALAMYGVVAETPVD